MSGKNYKAFVILFLLISIVIFSSGCLNNECKDLEKELSEKNLTCHCMKGHIVPDIMKNRTDIKPKCFCVCNINGKWENISIVQATP
ncbi:MAG: hypothetical protein J7K87_01115 [Candidatus Aenigmarchaeota archaeon]|nr:hypothetical protein [Candidatus Aenigmarchaeota archaeon]